MTDHTIKNLGSQELDSNTLQQVEGLLHLLNPGAGTIEAGRLARLIEEGRMMLFVAEGHSDEGCSKDGDWTSCKLTGMLTLSICPTLAQDKLWIEDVIVDDSCRGKGIGRALVQAAVAYAASKWPGNTVYLTSNPARQAARALYASEGFEEYNTGVFRLHPSSHLKH